jgi:cytochrome c2
MKQGSKVVLAAVAAAALGAAAAAFAHPGDRAEGGKQGAADCPMHTAMQQGEHRMGPGGRGQMEHRGLGMGQGMRHGQPQPAPNAEEPVKP